MTGDERERPMVIHRSAKPRCFKNIKTESASHLQQQQEVMDDCSSLRRLANTTSVLQPLDQGIIQALKLKVRRKQLQFIMDEMDKDKTSSGPELIKKEVFGCDFCDVADIDADLTVCESRQAEFSLTVTVEPVPTSTPPPQVDDSSESETEDVHESLPPTFQESRDAIALLRRFALHTGSTAMLDLVMGFSDQLSSISAMHMRQKKLGDYFSVSASSRK
ncbi:hypothetical protein BaRGS_00011124 [Batillaria attramentaria]|uniref:DDE-1 domain-containing protein n=1 Tax=Batillaria attramentaria TaxID=370345 RepID=A0ABD0LDU7_9CAEN